MSYHSGKFKYLSFSLMAGKSQKHFFIQLTQETNKKFPTKLWSKLSQIKQKSKVFYYILNSNKFDFEIFNKFKTKLIMIL